MTSVVEPDEAHAPAAPNSRWIRQLFRDWLAVAGLVFLVLVTLAAVFAPLIAPFDPSDQTGRTLAPPSGEHWLGTDILGRDTFSRLVYGARVSLQVSFATIALSVLVSVPIGIIAGYRGGWFDTFVMRIVVETGLAFPALVLALTVAAFLGPGTTNTVWALTVVIAPGFIRLVRSQARAVREESFVEASKSIGTGSVRIMTHRVFPSVLSPVIIQATVFLGAALLAEAALSFLGLGTRLPTPSWGNMLQEAASGALFTTPLQVLIPGLAIAVTILAINSLGDGLRDVTGIGRGLGSQKAERRGITSVHRDREEAARLAAVAAATPAAEAPLLRIQDLSIQFLSPGGPITAVKDLNLSINRGEVLGLVGESGSGKSVTASSIMRLLPSPPARIVSGRIDFDGTDLLSLPMAKLRTVRGKRISMIFQDPMTSMDPACTVGYHLLEAQRNHGDVDRRTAVKRAIELLELVRIPHAGERLGSYPHELSGGMRQRVMIAMALANNPDLLIADEPTTALDVTIQAQILDLLRDLQQDLGMALLFVTHDLGVIADIADRVAVMYAGQIVEEADVDTLCAHPRHPYPEGLLAAMPRLSQAGQRLREIPGVVPMPRNYPTGCRFHPRCLHAQEACSAGFIPLESFGAGSSVRCVRSSELTLRGTEARHAVAGATVDRVRGEVG